MCLCSVLCLQIYTYVQTHKYVYIYIYIYIYRCRSLFYIAFVSCTIAYIILINEYMHKNIYCSAQILPKAHLLTHRVPYFFNACKHVPSELAHTHTQVLNRCMHYDSCFTCIYIQMRAIQTCIRTGAQQFLANISHAHKHIRKYTYTHTCIHTYTTCIRTDAQQFPANASPERRQQSFPPASLTATSRQSNAFFLLWSNM